MVEVKKVYRKIEAADPATEIYSVVLRYSAIKEYVHATTSAAKKDRNSTSESCGIKDHKVTPLPYTTGALLTHGSG
jgi:hypothetical protein